MAMLFGIKCDWNFYHMQVKLGVAIIMNEINVSQLAKLPKESYELIDIRDEGSVQYGIIPDAIHVPIEELERKTETYLDKIDKDKKLVVYCQRGQKSVEITEKLEKYGRECWSLKGGYNAYLMSVIATDDEDFHQKKEKAENSIRKKFHKQIFLGQRRETLPSFGQNHLSHNHLSSVDHVDTLRGGAVHSASLQVVDGS